MALTVNAIYQGDARILLSEIALNSVACSVWSPPYHVGKNYEKDQSYDDWVNLLTEVIKLHYPILKPGGFLAINIADILAFPDSTMPRIQAQNLRRQRGDITRADVLATKTLYPEYNRQQLAAILGCSEQTVDRRLNGNNIRGGKYATQTRVHLVAAIIEKAGMEAGLYLYDRRVWVKDAAWESSKWHTLSYRSVDEFEYIYIFWKPGETIIDRNKLNDEEWVNWGSRGVWHIPSVRSNNDHEAKFPLEIPRRIIKLLSAPNDLILDCFIGSGTTALAAIQEGRNYIGIELLPIYATAARKACEAETKKINSKRQEAQQLNLPIAL